VRDLGALELGAVDLDDSKSETAKLVYMPFLNIKALDGRGANRGWLQELPDPLTKIVWDSWAEIHPHTAKKHGIKHGDLVSVDNYFGEVKLPAYVTKYVSKNVVAVPLGQGHSEYGRFASQVRRSSGAALKERDGDLGPRNEFRDRIDNAYDLLPRRKVRLSDTAQSGNLALVATKVAIRKLPGKSYITITQKHDSQVKRPIVQLDSIDTQGNVVKVDYHEHSFPDAQDMYDQRKHPLYRWGMSIDLSVCTGCSACVVACYAENNIPVVGKKVVAQERHMGWLRIDRYFDGPDDQPVTGFQPMMCQHCQNAPCEPVCPVYATYHNDEGLNVMVYNRCVGTRYCGNNCSYKVRRFNWFDFEFPSPLDWQLNPDVTKRTAGVMEKCTFCVQRINEGKDRAKDLGRLVADGEVQPACVQTCPTQAITFGNLKDSTSQVAKLSESPRAYKVLDYHLNTKPSVSYLRNRKFKV
jgi:molybdopterin-containing oxidoreductase family iron-sulfur binding subunit